MEVRISRRKFNVLAFDIESHNDEESIAKRETSMWLGCLINDESKIDDESCYFYNMDSVLDKLEELSNPKRKHGEKKRPCKNHVIYVYNLSFEWSFILPVLLKRGFRYNPNITDNDEYCFNSITTQSVSSVWNIELKFGLKSGKIIFRDLSKIYGGGLANVAKSFGLETQKGIIDYRKNRLHNYVVTKEEKEYCFKDTRILMEILIKIKERGDKTFFNVMSMASYSMKLAIRAGYPRDIKPYAEFRKDYPFLDEEETKFLRNSVSGGITYAPSGWQYKIINKKIIHIDKNSMHPSSAYFNYFPKGYGEYHTGEPKDFFNKINCCHIKVSYSGVKLHSVIELIGIDAIEDYELTCWDFEIKTMKKCYKDLEIEYIDYYAYNKAPLKWRRFFKSQYYLREGAKERGDSLMNLHHKLLMNSSYGKLLEKPHLFDIENIIDEEGIITSIQNKKEKSDKLTDDEWRLKCNNAKYTYLPVGSAIPAYSRIDLIELALKLGYENVVYFDTDSIFFLDTEETRKRMDKYMNKDHFLGGWKIEEYIDRAQFTAPKRYKAEVNGKTYIKAGGINFNDYITTKAHEEGINDLNEIQDYIHNYQFAFEEINIVNSSFRVQRAYRVKGGTIIEFQDKEIKIPKKYIEIYNKNM